MNKDFFKNSVKGLLIALASSVVLLTVFGYICYTREDPSSLFKPMGRIALYLSALIGGFAAARLNKENGLLAGLASGGLFSIVIIILSFMLRNGNESANLLTWLMFILTAVVAAFGGYIGRKSRNNRKKRNRKKR